MSDGSMDGKGSADPIGISIGICAYNEEANIERTLRSLFSQESGVYALD